MFKAGEDLFVQDPSREDRFLYRGQITSVEDGECHHVRLDCGHLPAHDQGAVLVYFHRDRDFLQQIMEILAVERDGLSLRPMGDPISANRRAQDRVSTLTAEIAARVDGHDGCRVQDVSATGFAVLADAGWRPGQVLDVSLGFEGRTWQGRACIQSVREMGPGRLRFGLRVMGTDAASGEDLLAAMPKISLDVRRSLIDRRGQRR